MKTVYNLTDAKTPRDIRVGSVTVKPGQAATLPDTFPIRTIKHLVDSGDLSVDHLPEWYQSGLRQRSDAIMEALRRK